MLFYSPDFDSKQKEDIKNISMKQRHGNKGSLGFRFNSIGETLGKLKNLRVKITWYITKIYSTISANIWIVSVTSQS